MEAVKIDQKAMQQEKEALKKLANVKQDHMKRLQDLSNMQKNNILQGQLIGKEHREDHERGCREKKYRSRLMLPCVALLFSNPADF